MSNDRKKGVSFIADIIEQRIVTGSARDGEYLPSIRSLSSELGCSALTAQRALKQLAGKGFVQAEPRLGYLVTASKIKKKKGVVVAFLENTENYEQYLGDIYQTQISTLQHRAIGRKWSVLILPYEEQSPEHIKKQLQEMNATALILQNIGYQFPPELSQSLCSLGLPVISLDTPETGSGMDHVLRDEHQGALLAAEYLIEKGHTRIGWYGPLNTSPNSLRRFSGAAEALLRSGLGIDEQGWEDIGTAIDPETARAYLERDDRPKAVLALWQTAALTLGQAAVDCGLTLGKDVDIVGWSLEEHLEPYAAECPELSKACAVITWSMADVGQLVMNRIEERRTIPDLAPAWIFSPMKLKLPG